MAHSPFRYQGLDQYGLARHGQVFTSNLSMFIAQHYTRGWQHLTVDCNGRKVGAIVRHEGWSSWWAERADGNLDGMCKITLGDGPMD